MRRLLSRFGINLAEKREEERGDLLGKTAKLSPPLRPLSSSDSSSERLTNLLCLAAADANNGDLTPKPRSVARSSLSAVVFFFAFFGQLERRLRSFGSALSQSVFRFSS